MKKILPILAVGALLAGCASMMTLRESPEVVDDGFEPVIKVLGVERTMPNMGLNTYMNRYYIRSFVPRSGGAAEHQIYIIRTYTGDWHFYDRAAFRGGSPAEFVQIDRDVDCSQYGCTYYEHMAVNLPPGYLEANKTGFAIKVYSQKGHSFTVDIKSAQISAQLSAVPD